MQLNYILFCQLPCCLRSIPISSHFPRSPLFHVINPEFCTSIQHCLFLIRHLSILHWWWHFYLSSYLFCCYHCILSLVFRFIVMRRYSKCLFSFHASSSCISLFSALFRYISEPSQDMVAVRFGFANGRLLLSTRP